MLNFVEDRGQATTKFKIIKTGDTFEHSRTPYMKIRVNGKDEAVNLETGTLQHFDDDFLVRPTDYIVLSSEEK